MGGILNIVSRSMCFVPVLGPPLRIECRATAGDVCGHAADSKYIPVTVHTVTCVTCATYGCEFTPCHFICIENRVAGIIYVIGHRWDWHSAQAVVLVN